MSGENSAGPSYSGRRKINPVTEMAAFDRLPAEVRACLRNTDTQYIAEEMESLLRMGCPARLLITEIGRHEALNHQALVEAGWVAP